MKMGPDAEKRQRRLEVDRPPYEVVGELERFDERDTPQARGELTPDTPRWQDYYARRPESEENDRSMKELPGMGMVGDPLDRPMVMTLGLAISRYSNEEVIGGAPVGMKGEISPQRAALRSASPSSWTIPAPCLSWWASTRNSFAPARCCQR